MFKKALVLSTIALFASVCGVFVTAMYVEHKLEQIQERYHVQVQQLKPVQNAFILR